MINTAIIPFMELSVMSGHKFSLFYALFTIYDEKAIK